MRPTRDLRDLGAICVRSCLEPWCVRLSAGRRISPNVAEVADSGQAQFHTLYDNNMPLWEKARHIARTLYGADDIIADKKVRDQFARLQADGYGDFPVCMAKTPVQFFHRSCSDGCAQWARSPDS